MNTISPSMNYLLNRIAELEAGMAMMIEAQEKLKGEHAEEVKNLKAAIPTEKAADTNGS